jgi:tRNA (mo5U34)-methyltransferase
MPEARRGKDFSQELAERGWYHSFELPDGTTIEGYNKIDTLRRRWSRFPVPESLAGKRLLDIGAWDGWFSFEAERRGAAVTAIDCVEIPNFLEIRRRLGSQVEYRLLDFYELPTAGLAAFDYVFCLGVLYHLKHPLLALEIVCALTLDTAVVESFTIDSDNWQEHVSDVPVMEFYETDELGNQLDNWIGPSVSCLMAMCRAAGFARVELLQTLGYHASVGCHRKWEPVPEAPTRRPPELTDVVNSRSFGVNFNTRKEEYVTCWFRMAENAVTRGELRLEIGPFGVPALYVRPDGEGMWMANFRLPPGIGAGWQPVRLRFADSDFAASVARIAVDMPVKVERLRADGLCDGVTWKKGEVSLEAGGALTCWVEGLPENADRANVTVWLDDLKVAPCFVGEPDDKGMRQVNALLPPALEKGERVCVLECGGMRSDGVPVNVV